MSYEITEEEIQMIKVYGVGLNVYKNVTSEIGIEDVSTAFSLGFQAAVKNLKNRAILTDEDIVDFLTKNNVV